ncbi:hypothetical protein FOL47_010551, partial [Perkinsus chesapeaki]
SLPRPFPRSVEAIEQLWQRGEDEVRKGSEELERLRMLAREGLENAGLAESVERTYATYWPPMRDSLLVPAGVGAAAFLTATRSGQLAAYLSTITSKMPITGRLTGYSIIFGGGAVVGKTAEYFSKRSSWTEDESLLDSFKHWDAPTTVRDGMVLEGSGDEEEGHLPAIRVALLMFTMLGGSWRSVLPSSVLYRGSFWSPKLEQALPGNLRSSRDVQNAFNSLRHSYTSQTFVSCGVIQYLIDSPTPECYLDENCSAHLLYLGGFGTDPTGGMSSCEEA